MNAYIIYLPDCPHSVVHSQLMMSQLASYKIKSELFEGTPGNLAVGMAQKDNKTLYPYSIKNRTLTDHDIEQLIRPELYQEFKKKHKYEIIERQLVGVNEVPKLSLPGVIGCFYSHYNLWKKCVDLDTPIMIFEDDVKFFRGYSPVEFQGVLILSLGKTSYLAEPQKNYLENPNGTPVSRKWKNFSMPGNSGYAITPDAARALVKFYRPYWSPADNAINQFVVPIEINTHLMGRNILKKEGNISMTRSGDWL